jgi:hypothetical protein
MCYVELARMKTDARMVDLIENRGLKWKTSWSDEAALDKLARGLDKPRKAVAVLQRDDALLT